MILITGGQYQGKLGWCMTQYNIKKEQVLDFKEIKDENLDIAMRDKCVWYHLEYLQEGRLRDLLDMPLPKIIIAAEIGCGVVPIDPVESKKREIYGQVMSAISQKAERVIRIVCAQPLIIK